MRGWFLVALSSATLAAAAACASSEPEVTSPSSESDSGPPVLPDGGAKEAEADVADVEIPRCSPAGWCSTPLPDTDLVFKDIWPFRGHAFAIAESPTIGVKILEWRDAEDKWQYIDDKTQNEVGLGKFVGTIWAPNDDEVYFAVAPAFIYHGKRPAAPATAWTWVRHRLEDHNLPHTGHDHGYPIFQPIGATANYPALGVWGTGADNVYAWYGNAIYRWKSEDGGAPAWVTEYVADDAETSPDPYYVEDMYFVSAGGTGPDDVWFTGARDRRWGTCPIVLRKTSAGYTRIADGIVANNIRSPCQERPGFVRIGGVYGGWITDIHLSADGQAIGLKSSLDTSRDGKAIAAVRISEQDGGYAADFSYIPMLFASGEAPRAMNSLWRSPEGLWLSGYGIVLRSVDVWDGGTYQASTIARNGAPLNRPIYRIRGTGSDNLWAIGARNALHKTTP